MTDYQKVRRYQENMGVKCSNVPTLISKKDGFNMIVFALHYLHAFALTITRSTEEATELIHNSLGVDPSSWEEKNELELIEDQEDAICDTWVYMLNVATQFGLHIVIDPESGNCCRQTKDSPDSDYQMVKRFTTAAGTECTGKRTLISHDRGSFLLRHALSELHEFALTITQSTEEGHDFLKDCFESILSFNEWKDRTEEELVRDQEDAICGVWISLLKVASRYGQDVSSMMKVVMKSNMAKIDPETGKCKRRESDGKIMKPKGWTPPDTKKEILRQIANGTSSL